ncbi:hypothetical protein [Fluviicola sp.]|uniref:hypothetical protein n=1 Tax=Fluviicola sp. TaxID=1917219 RepID=UPI003D2B440B
MRIASVFCLAIAFIFLNSCEKQEKTCANPPSSLSISTNGPVTEGWPLIFTLSGYESGYGYTYRLKGPNGFFQEKQLNTTSYEAGKITLDSVSVNDSGDYLIELLYEGCLIKKGTTNVQVTAVPSPPCSTPNNSSTTTVNGLVGGNFYLISADDGFNYDVSASSNNGTIHFIFKDDEPKPGMYMVEAGNSPSAVSGVSVYIQLGTYYYFLESNTPVYVNKVNGKLQFAFCDGHFEINPSNTAIISARLTLP